MAFVPEKVTYVFGRQETTTTGWDDKQDDLIIEQIVTPAFPIPTGNEKRLETARNWAKGKSWYWANGQYIEDKNSPGVQEVTVDNTPFTLQICGLEHRSMGGRAYKVVTPDGFYFDFREDVLLDSLLNVGIKPGGHLGGKFIWVSRGSQMKIVRDGSALHRRIVAEGQRQELPPIEDSDLQLGGIYRGKDAEPKLFIGFVKSGKTAKKNRCLWCYLDYSDWRKKTIENPEEQLATALKGMNMYRFGIGSVRVTEKIGEIKLSSDTISTIRTQAHLALKDDLSKNTPTLRGRQSHEDYRKATLKNWRSLCLMRSPDETHPSIPEYEKPRKAKAKNKTPSQ